jgi:putative redox protein
MGTVKVRWIGGQQYVGIDSTNHSVVMSTAAEGVGMKPSELVLVALAACTGVDVVDILSKKRTPLTSLEIVVDGEQDEDPPWAYRKIHILYRLRGKGLSDKNVSQAIKLSEEKYCCVSATLRGIAEISAEFEILPEAEEAASG